MTAALSVEALPPLMTTAPTTQIAYCPCGRRLPGLLGGCDQKRCIAREIAEDAAFDRTQDC